MAAGKVQLVYQEFPALGAGSVRAATAAEAAAEQGKFWAYHDQLYEAFAADGAAALENDSLRTLAVAVGLNLQKFDESASSQRVADKITAEKNGGQNRGVSATPTIFVNDRKIQGLLPYPVLRSVVEEALAN